MGKGHNRRNGEGSIYQRKDSRWCAEVYVLTSSGSRKRKQMYGKTCAEVTAKLELIREKNRHHLPVADKRMRLGEYLDYWLEHVIYGKKAPKKCEQYEGSVRLYIKPPLGMVYLDELTVKRVQLVVNDIAETKSIRRAEIARKVLGAALTNAMREEILMRNVAWLVNAPYYEPKPIYPWTPSEVTRFLRGTRSHRYYPAFLVMTHFGLRLGELLGLRWEDIDFENDVIHLRQQVQRTTRALIIRTLKTKNSVRDLPLLPNVKEVLQAHKLAMEAVQQVGLGKDLVFVTTVGTAIEPRNFGRSFNELCNALDLPIIKLHHIRHTTATMLKNLGVPARDVQLILGHATAWTTTQIYQHDDVETRRGHIEWLSDLLMPKQGEDDKEDEKDQGDEKRDDTPDGPVPSDWEDV